MPECQFPLCTRNAEKNGYCVGHRIYANNTPAPKEDKNSAPKKKAFQPPIKKRSEKMKDEMKGYKKQLKAFLSKPENIVCKIQMEGCTKLATVVHHTAGRTGKKLKDESDWLPSCAGCNIKVEANDGEARDKGFLKTKLTKVKPVINKS